MNEISTEVTMFFVEQLPIWISHYGYIAIFLLLMLGIVGLPVPDETLLILLGYLVLKGDLRFAPAFMTVLAGTICGITFSYTIGRTGGIALVKKHGVLLHVNDARLALVRQWFDRIGKWSLMLGYFIPGVRHMIAIVAGISGFRLSTFMRFAYTGALIWSAVFITAGYIIGKEWRRFSEAIHGFMLWAVLIVVVISAGYMFYRKSLNKNRRR
jgi:membrane protein DedA with SNARE-associated domain